MLIGGAVEVVGGGEEEECIVGIARLPQLELLLVHKT